MAQQTIDIIQLKHPDTGDVFYPQTHVDGVVGLSGNKDANTVLAAPNGAAGPASFRKLVLNDLPNLANLTFKDTTNTSRTYNGKSALDLSSGLYYAENARNLVPLCEKEYTYKCASTSDNDANIYFMDVTPTSSDWATPWQVHYLLSVDGLTSDSTNAKYCHGEYDIWVGCSGSTVYYHIFNKFYSSSYYPIYSHRINYHNSEAKYISYHESHPAKLGVRVQSAWGANTVGRKYTIKVYETLNCTVSFPDTIEIRGSVYYTTYYGETAFNATSIGLQESGDATDTTTMQLAYSRVYAGTNGLMMYSLIMQDGNGTWQSFTTEGGTSTSKHKNPVGFRLGSNIYYLNQGVISASTDSAANANGTAVKSGSVCTTSAIRPFVGLVDFRYSLNIASNNTSGGPSVGLTRFKPVFIVGTINTNDGLFYLDDQWWTQDEPTTDDGKIYIKICESVHNENGNNPNGQYRGDLVYLGTPFYYKNGRFQEYNRAGSSEITELGTITSGVWNGSTIDNTFLTNPYITLNGSRTNLGASFNTASITGGTAGSGSSTTTLPNIPYVTVNNYGIVTAYGSYTPTAAQIVNTLSTTPVNRATSDADGNTISSTYLKLSGGTVTGILTIKPTNTSSYQDGLILTDPGAGNSEGLKIKWTSGSYTSGIALYPNANLTNLTIDGNRIYHAGNANLTSVNWNAKALTLAGAISGATTGSFSSNVTIGGTLTVGTTTTNKDTTLNGKLSVTGNTTLSSNVYLGTSATADTDWSNGQYLQWDNDHKAWHLIGNFYADGFVSAGGWSDGSGTSGIDWDALATNDSSHKIDVSHIPNITTSKITDLESWISEKGYVTSSGITSIVKGTATSGGAVSTSGSTVTIQFPTAYSLPIAKSDTLGGIKVGSGLSINATTGVLSATYSYTLPTASASTLGGIKVGSGLAITDAGVLSATYSYTLPLAANGTRGGIQIGYTESGTNYAVKLSSEKAYVTVPWTDTKNTAGSTDTSSKIFLIGATSQAANPQTYSDNEVYVTSGTLTTNKVQIGDTAVTVQYNSTDKCIEFIFN